MLLGHTAHLQQADGPVTPRNLRECEAEAVALLCCAALQLSGVDGSRGDIRLWWGQGNAIPERSAQAVLDVADQILKAGRCPMTLHLTSRDVRTLVSALHAWQNELSYHTVEELCWWHPELRDHRPLTIEEVENLLGRLLAPGQPRC